MAALTRILFTSLITFFCIHSSASCFTIDDYRVNLGAALFPYPYVEAAPKKNIALSGGLATRTQDNNVWSLEIMKVWNANNQHEEVNIDLTSVVFEYGKLFPSKYLDLILSSGLGYIQGQRTYSTTSSPSIIGGFDFSDEPPEETTTFHQVKVNSYYIPINARVLFGKNVGLGLRFHGGILDGEFVGGLMLDTYFGKFKTGK